MPKIQEMAAGYDAELLCEAGYGKGKERHGGYCQGVWQL